MELKGRKVVDVEVDGVDPSDYPDFCDAYFCYAVFQDDGTELDEYELDQLTELYGDVVNEMAYEYYM